MVEQVKEMRAIPVDNWCCGNCQLNKKCKRSPLAIACCLIHQNYKNKGYELQWIMKGWD